MSKKNNVVPDHFKTAGREPQGQGVPHEVLRQEYGKEKKIAKGDGTGRTTQKSRTKQSKQTVPGKESA